ncbi:hypothetical protein E2C01_065728 [Portunus trituberculatus]|uniref:Uncharacterized protein n=1 Tax=Portunus trituberculatus TaxID=210409 RepID=A0A5B7HFC8_PORTR|nr:hypothetical protein [Portunus trituberculatus]
MKDTGNMLFGPPCLFMTSAQHHLSEASVPKNRGTATRYFSPEFERIRLTPTRANAPSQTHSSGACGVAGKERLFVYSHMDGHSLIGIFSSIKLNFCIQLLESSTI